MALQFNLPRAVKINIAGRPYAGATMNFYQTGTDVLQTVYQDSDLQTPHDSFIVADDDGYFPVIWLDENAPADYRVLIVSASGVTLDDISGIQRKPISFTSNELAATLDSLARTSAEIVAAVTPTDFSYPPGDLRRYGCDVTGVTDNSIQIANAISAAVASGGLGYIYHPGGVISHSGQISVPNGLSVIGWNRASCVFQFTGTPAGADATSRSAWRYANGPNSSGYAHVSFKSVKLFYKNTVDFAAALELNAGGWSYFDVDDCWVAGNCSYGIILDAVEICRVKGNLIENINATSNYNIWIPNGGDRIPAQGQGYSNLITLTDNQLSSNSPVSIGIVDDGGNGRRVQGNNFNGHSTPWIFAGVTGMVTGGNSYETTQELGSANVQVNSVAQSGVAVGPCAGVMMIGDGYYGNMLSGSLLSFGGALNTVTNITKATTAVVTVSTVSTANPFKAGAPLSLSGVSGMTQINGVTGFITAAGGSSGAWTATTSIDSSGFSTYTSGGQAQMMHSGFFVAANTFGDRLGRGAAIDVTFLANSECKCNTDYGLHTGDSHYTGVHNDANGNVLMPPANGFGGAITSAPSVPHPIFGDSRLGYIFAAPLGSNGATPPAQLAGWGTPTSPAVQNNYSGSAATLVQTSAAVAEIIAYLKSKGDFAA